MAQEDFELFIEDLSTKEDLLNLLDEIRIASELVFTTGKLEKQKSISKEFVSKLIKAEEAGVFPELASKRNKFFEGLEEFVRAQKTIKMTVAFDPSDQFLSRIRKFLEEGAKQKVFLDLTIQPEIIGGFVLEEAGVYSDYSLSGQLSKAASDTNFLKELLFKSK